MKIALVHDWLVSYRGGEKVLEAISRLYPEATIYTLFYDSKKMPESISQKKIFFPKKLNLFRSFRQLLLPALPSLIESLPLFEYDLIISTSSCVAKGILPSPSAKHICYLHSPMRYIWDQRDEYGKSLSLLPGLKTCMNLAASKLRLWDVVSSNRVDKFVVNSSFIAQRVKRYYGRESTVVHPPIDIDFYKLPEQKKEKEPYFLIAGAFVPYKHFDLAIHACEKIGKKLIVAGSGGDESKLRKLAGRFTEFRISPKNEEWRELLQNAEALLFPGVEDFGMIAIEAMACGTPVIAFEKGGAIDFIKPGVTGEFFPEQTVDSLSEIISSFDRSNFDSSEINKFASNFSTDIFLDKFKKEISHLIEKDS